MGGWLRLKGLKIQKSRFQILTRKKNINIAINILTLSFRKILCKKKSLFSNYNLKKIPIMLSVVN